MKHIVFSDTAEDTPTFKVAVLIKDSYFDKTSLEEHYVNPMVKQGIDVDDIIAFNLPYPAGKITVSKAKENLAQILLACKTVGVGTVFVADANYFKALTGHNKADSHIGYILPCKIRGYEHINVCYGINYAVFIHNPNQVARLDLALDTLTSHIKGSLVPLGHDALKYCTYITDFTDLTAIQNQLDRLLLKPLLVCDIENYGLKLDEGGVASISFAWSKHEATAIYTRIAPTQDYRDKLVVMLRQFFERYKGKMVYHNGIYDIKHIIYNLFMDNPRDSRGMLHGLHTMFKSIHDTKIIAYLATNTTAGNELGLKVLAHPFLGNYAEDVTDITTLTVAKLLEYNAKDCIGTFYVFEKYYPLMLQDMQEEIYNNIMLPSAKIITQMEIHGMPIDIEQVIQTQLDMQQASADYLQKILQSPHVIDAINLIRIDKLTAINAALKVKQHGMEKVADEQFNPGSPDQMQVLLYDVLKMPVIDKTKTGNPATGAKTLDKLINHTDDDSVKELLTTLIDYSKVNKILSTFIPAFLGAQQKGNWHYLHGSFNIGGTLSGRLSSSNPNMQNIPSGSTHGKAVKKCFRAPKGWVFVGADSSSLEDRIITLLTKDTNRLKVYTDGYDGHCLRAYTYFKEYMPDIIPNDVASINSIDKLYPSYRQDSKAPTFALSYLGTHYTLMKNCGFSEEQSKSIEYNFHELYKESGDWLADKLQECCETGYATVAFGLRIRTPLLAKSILNTGATANESNSEARSVGNAISGQSYGLLNNRAAIAFMQKVWESEYKYDIFLVSLIHDAIYLMVKDNVEVIKWVNDNLIEEMQWQELPEIQHDEVKLGAELDIYYPNWSTPITLDNDIEIEAIKETVKKALS